MFRRSKTAEAPVATTPEKLAGKGRPTPSRREAEAAAKARAKGVADRKAAARNARRGESSQKIREAMKNGDERYLPARDKGPVRRFVRDWIDARFSVAEMLLPLLVIGMIGGSINQNASSAILNVTILLVALDTAYLVFRLRRELRRRFPDTSTKGAVGYGVLRALQLRWIRLPKAKVKLGQKLPQRY